MSLQMDKNLRRINKKEDQGKKNKIKLSRNFMILMNGNA